MLEVHRALPDRFFDLQAHELHEVMSGPTLFHLRGRRSPALFISILLHGNEDVGLKAVQRALGAFQNRILPRDCMLLVGNTEAARANLRKMPQQFDFNRVWPGTDLPPSPIADTMYEVVEYARREGVFASLDLHNNTGPNPHYGCINRVDARTLQLAMLFARTIVYFQRPKGVQSAAMSELCPSITCECGQIGDAAGVERAANLIDACLHTHELPDHLPAASDYHLLHTVATIQVDSSASFGFDETDASLDLVLPHDLVLRNFRPLQVGTTFGRQTSTKPLLRVVDEQARDVTSDYLELREGQLMLRRCAIPSMLTANLRVIRDDCLGYFMDEWRAY